MVKCNNGCGVVPVNEKDLPVILPDMDTFTEKKLGVEGGGSPLLRATDWITTDCPKCGKPGAKRETDTLDTFVDSSWYFLRYLDPNNHNQIIESSENNCKHETVSSGMPVNLYIGGKEHATLHLYFARFVTHFLQSVSYTHLTLPTKA